jgi:hypothetical protein
MIEVYVSSAAAFWAEGGPTLTLSRAAAGSIERGKRRHETALKTNARLRAAQRRRLERAVGPGAEWTMGREAAVARLHVSLGTRFSTQATALLNDDVARWVVRAR